MCLFNMQAILRLPTLSLDDCHGDEESGDCLSMLESNYAKFSFSCCKQMKQLVTLDYWSGGRNGDAASTDSF